MTTDPADFPYWTDDELIDRTAHRLNLHQDGPETTAGCTCGEWSAVGWDRHAAFESYDAHMYQVQEQARKPA